MIKLLKSRKFQKWYFTGESSNGRKQKTRRGCWSCMFHGDILFLNMLICCRLEIFTNQFHSWTEWFWYDRNLHKNKIRKVLEKGAWDRAEDKGRFFEKDKKIWTLKQFNSFKNTTESFSKLFSKSLKSKPNCGRFSSNFTNLTNARNAREWFWVVSLYLVKPYKF